MKGLHDLSPLCTAPNLEEVLVLDMAHLTLDDIGCLSRMPTLRTANVFLGRERKNSAARNLLQLPPAAGSISSFGDRPFLVRTVDNFCAKPLDF